MGQGNKVGYYCKRSSHYRDCPESAYCLFSTTGMTSAKYNKQVRNCNNNQDTTFASVQKESTHYCVCGSNTWKKAHPTHEKYYLRYTYHKTKTVKNGKNVYSHGYICLPRYTRKQKACKANSSKTNPSTSFCKCAKG